MFIVSNDITGEILYQTEDELKAYWESVELGCKGYSVSIEEK